MYIIIIFDEKDIVVDEIIFYGSRSGAIEIAQRWIYGRPGWHYIVQ